MELKYFDPNSWKKDQGPDKSLKEQLKDQDKVLELNNRIEELQNKNMDLEWLLSVDIKQEITRLKKENDKMAD